jgi:hypothetical protein
LLLAHRENSTAGKTRTIYVQSIYIYYSLPCYIFYYYSRMAGEYTIVILLKLAAEES